ncbi:hypothetical protein Vadar_008138 [Vaccinium darrowii]|uniref:Uncharacterized protein n=1 Tax=Vaccinium darrowii TaxID=229202 RepID=A0ACB7YU71_9ERIC|nr:hypothetical protein Vadar_008138 [Vaccinium darrowii]
MATSVSLSEFVPMATYTSLVPITAFVCSRRSKYPRSLRRPTASLPFRRTVKKFASPSLSAVSNPKPTPLLLPRHQSNIFAAWCPTWLPPIPIQIPPNLSQSLLHGSTRTITNLCAIALSLPRHLASEMSLTLFFDAINGSIRTPPMSTLTPIAAIAARWLEIYSRVLLIRVLLGQFPNTRWDKQPMSAIRNMCDPYLSLFNGIIPPLNNSLDVNPLLAFLVLGILVQLARPPTAY